MDIWITWRRSHIPRPWVVQEKEIFQLEVLHVFESDFSHE